jgi:hypothetical protein
MLKQKDEVLRRKQEVRLRICNHYYELETQYPSHLVDMVVYRGIVSKHMLGISQFKDLLLERAIMLRLRDEYKQLNLANTEEVNGKEER